MSELDKILPAIAAAIGSVSKLGKDNKNEHQRYMFASIDDFLAMVNPICADNGLIFHMQETALEEFDRVNAKGEATAWFRMHYSITVYHTSGQSLPPVSRSVEVQRTGAQASGSAQSYALKQFMRALFMIPTGDKDDADFRDHGAGTVSAKHPKRKSFADMKRDLAQLDNELVDCHSVIQVNHLAKDWGKKMDAEGWPETQFGDEDISIRQQVINKIQDRRKELLAMMAAEPEPREVNILAAGE